MPARYKNIWLIDDDDDDQEIFGTALLKTNLDVACTPYSSAFQALEELRNGNSYPELIFLDLNMPLMNGQQFLEAIKDCPKLKGIPIIVLTTSSTQQTIEETIALGAVDFYSKPDRFEDLTAILRKILA
jgi:CheY-like chemotaxis protein